MHFWQLWPEILIAKYIYLGIIIWQVTGIPFTVARGREKIVTVIPASKGKVLVRLAATGDIDLKVIAKDGTALLRQTTGTNWGTRMGFSYNGMSFNFCTDSCSASFTATYSDTTTYSIAGSSAYGNEFIYIDETTEDLTLYTVGYQAASGTVSVLFDCPNMCGGVCSVQPTFAPTVDPTKRPTPNPTDIPTPAPTGAPSASPTASPSQAPSASPSKLPTIGPTASPSQEPSASPTGAPSASPSTSPTVSPSFSLRCLPRPVHEVTVNGLEFDPPMVEVNVGDIVVFRGLAPNHNVVQTAGPDTCNEATRPMEFESHVPGDWQFMQPNYKYYHVFRTPGTYFYKCGPHCHFGMRGTIVVRPRSCGNMVYKWGNVGGGVCLSHGLCTSESPTTSPTLAPSASPTMPSSAPTISPSTVPSSAPSALPSVSPSTSPTHAPTHAPSYAPTKHPTPAPTKNPTPAPVPPPPSGGGGYGRRRTHDHHLDTWIFMHDTEAICLASCCTVGQCPTVTCPTLQYELEIPTGKCCNECVMKAECADVTCMEHGPCLASANQTQVQTADGCCSYCVSTAFESDDNDIALHEHFTLGYTVDQVAGTIEFTATVRGDACFFGVGFPSPAGHVMSDMDVTWGYWQDAETPILTDLRARGFTSGHVTPDASQDLTLLAAERSNDGFSMTWRRNLDTGDAVGDRPITLTAPMKLAFVLVTPDDPSWRPQCSSLPPQSMPHNRGIVNEVMFGNDDDDGPVGAACRWNGAAKAHGEKWLWNNCTSRPCECVDGLIYCCNWHRTLHELSTDELRTVAQRFREANGGSANPNPEYRDLIYSHLTSAQGGVCAHGSSWFLPWHRAYIAIMNKLVQDRTNDVCFTIPFWDWTRDQGKIPASGEIPAFNP